MERKTERWKFEMFAVLAMIILESCAEMETLDQSVSIT